MLTCDYIEAGFMENAREHFETNDGVNYNDKKNEESDMKERNHRHQNSVNDNLEA